MSVGRTAPMSRRRYSTACLAQACRVASDAPLASILSGGPRLWPWTQRPRRLSVATVVAARHSSWLCGLRGQVDPNMRRHDQTTLQFFELVLKARLEPARPEASAFEATAAVSSTAWTQLLAEGIRIELMDPVKSHGLASRCIATLPTFLYVVPKETFRTPDLPLTRRLLFLLSNMGKHGVGGEF